MAIVRVAVIEHKNPQGKKEFLVRPSVVFLEYGDVFRLLNTTRGLVTITTTAPGIRKKNSRGATVARHVDAGQAFEVPVPLHRGSGLSPREFTILVNGVRAIGDSDPRIIIDNP